MIHIRRFPERAMALIDCHFFSETLKVQSSMLAILPQPATTGQIGIRSRAARAPATGHPVLWLLHGMSDDHTIWLRRTGIERYVAPLGLAVIMPAVGRSYYTDQKRGYDYWTFISEELPALARSFFHLSDRPEDNFVAGLSMGGYGAFKLALRHPGRFAAAASFSGALDAASIYQRRPEGIGELDHTFGSLDELCGSDNDLFHLAEQRAGDDQPLPRLYACCGTEDFLHEDNLRFRDHCKAVGLDLTYEQGPGSHEWGYWDTAIQRALTWMGLTEPAGA
jgi:S-formylglutathione hydrolase FrmB